MTQARPVIRTFPQTIVYGAAALVAAVVISATLTIGNLDIFGPASRGGNDVPSQAVLRSEASWLTQRLAQSGFIEPSVRSARFWEAERLQQSAAYR